MATAKIDGIEIPGVFQQKTRRVIVGDKSESAKGITHLDVVNVKRIWPIGTRAITTTQRDALIDHLDAILWGEVDFWLDEFGSESNTVAAFVEIEEDRPLELSDRRALSLTITEKGS